MENTDVITFAEMEVYDLLVRAGEVARDTTEKNIHAIADIIILLAEKIKAQRATAAMF